LSDTVGFIKKLPIELITAFKATLEEVREADCICHIIDTSSSNSDSQIETVENILSELGVVNIPILKVFNKIDLLPNASELLIKNRNSDNQRVFASAKTGDGIESLKDNLRTILFKDLKLFYLRIPKSNRKLIHSFPKWTFVLKRRENNEFYELKIMANPKSLENYLPYIKRGEVNW